MGKLREAVAAQNTAGPSAETLTVEQISDKAMPFFIGSRLPQGLTGLVIAGIFAAAMSTISTCLNSSATLLLTEVYQRYIDPGVSQRRAMLVLYGTSFVWGGLGTAAGLALIPISRAIPNALDSWWLLSGIFSGGMLGLFLLGRMLKRPSNAGAMVAVIVGVLAILWMSVSSETVLDAGGTSISMASVADPRHRHGDHLFSGRSVVGIVGSLAKRFAAMTRLDERSPHAVALSLADPCVDLPADHQQLPDSNGSRSGIHDHPGRSGIG